MFEFYLSGELASPYTMPVELDLAEYNLFDDFATPESPLDTPATTPSTSGRSSPLDAATFLDFSFPADLNDVFVDPQALEQSFAAFSEERSFSFADDSSSSVSDDDSKMELKMKPMQKKRGRRPNSVVLAARSMSHRSASDELVQKRSSHNVSERQRRKDLKSSFQALRECIPSVADDPRVHTSHILKQAIDFIEQLKAEEARLVSAKVRLMSA